MDKNFLIFIAWVGLILLSQVTKGKKRKRKKRPKILPTVKKRPAEQSPDGTFVCEEAQQAPEKIQPVQPDLVQDLRPLRPDLQQDIKEELKVLRPTVAETKNNAWPRKKLHTRLQGNLREGMLWTMVLGEPRSKVSWGRQQKQNYFPE